MMKDNGTLCTAVLVLILLAFLLGRGWGIAVTRHDAIKNCKAAYVLIDNSTGATEFRWNPPLTPEDYK